VIAHGISAVRHGLRVDADGSGRIELFATVEQAVAAAG
jgi:hypothetical protein